MGLKFLETVERMKAATGLQTDTELAKALDITPGAISNFKKRGEIPTDLVVLLAVKYKLSVDWLLTGEGEMQRGSGEKPLAVSEPGVIYTHRNDSDLSEIISWLKENPGDKKPVSKLIKLLKSKKEYKEALESVGLKGLVDGN